ncbi:hypothetical protein HKD37_03G006665 [Glycine soja]
MSSSSTMPLSSDPPFLCADEAAIVGLLDVEPHHMPEKDYLRRCRDHSINITAVGKGSAFAPGLFAVKVNCMEVASSIGDFGLAWIHGTCLMSLTGDLSMHGTRQFDWRVALGELFPD